LENCSVSEITNKVIMVNEKFPSLNELTFDEINAILEHKWYLSERAGHDVGMEFARNDFFSNHSRKWRVQKMKEDFVAQKAEILKHKWYLSEKHGYDVGIEKAAFDWIKCGFAQHWRTCSGPYHGRIDNKFCKCKDE